MQIPTNESRSNAKKIELTNKQPRKSLPLIHRRENHDFNRTGLRQQTAMAKIPWFVV